MIVRLALLLLSGTLSSTALADPEADRKAFRDYYQSRFSGVALEAHKDGVYAIDAQAREQWLELEEFPLYEIAVDEGAEYFAAEFAVGANYSECFAEAGVKHNYPYFDETSKQIVTLEVAINQCRVEQGAEPLAYNGEEQEGTGRTHCQGFLYTGYPYAQAHLWQSDTVPMLHLVSA